MQCTSQCLLCAKSGHSPTGLLRPLPHELQCHSGRGAGVRELHLIGGDGRNNAALVGCAVKRRNCILFSSSAERVAKSDDALCAILSNSYHFFLPQIGARKNSTPHGFRNRPTNEGGPLSSNVRFGSKADISSAKRHVRSSSGGRYLSFSQTIMPTPSRPSIGLLLGAVFIVKVSPSNLKNLT